jgi:hypothetical protein
VERSTRLHPRAANDTETPLAESGVRQISREAALGIHDAVAEIGLTPEPLPSRSDMSNVLRIAVMLIAIVLVIALGLLTALVLLALAIWRQRRKPTVVTGSLGINRHEVNSDTH